MHLKNVDVTYRIKVTRYTKKYLNIYMLPIFIYFHKKDREKKAKTTIIIKNKCFLHIIYTA